MKTGFAVSFHLVSADRPFGLGSSSINSDPSFRFLLVDPSFVLPSQGVVIPKNEYGNFDLTQSSFLPPGCAHISGLHYAPKRAETTES